MMSREKAKSDNARVVASKDAARLFYLTFMTLGAITYLFTPYTSNLDEIKVSLTFSLGPILLAYFVYLFLVKRSPLPLPPVRVLIPLGIFFLIMIVSTILAQPFCRWRGVFVIGKHIALLGLLFCMAASIIDLRVLINALYIFVLIVLGTTIFGLLQYGGLFDWIWKNILNQQLAGPFDYFGTLVYTFVQAKDMLSTILNRDFYANYLVTLTPLVLCSPIVFESRTRRLVSIITLILVMVCIYFTFSKDSLVTYIFIFIFFFFFYNKFARFKKIQIPHLHIWAIGILIILITLIFFTWQIAPEKLKGIEPEGIARTLESRWIIWYGAIRIFLAHPIIGGGPGCFYLLFPQYRRPDYFLHDISHVTLFAHNRYLDLLAETGLLGFLVYMTFTVAILYYGFRQFFTDANPQLRVIQLGLLTSIVGCLITNMTSPHVRWVVVGTNFWAILGLSLGCYGLSARSSVTIMARPRRGSIHTAASIILFILTLCITLASNVFAVCYFIGAKLNNDGLIYNGYEQYEQAIDSFEKGLKFNPTFITSYYKLAHSYNKLGRHDKALETYQRLIKYAPDYAEVHYNLGVVYASLGQNDKALAEFIKAANMEHKVITKRAAAEAYMKLNQLQEAKEMLLDALQIDANDEFIIYRLAELSLVRGEFPDAEKFYRQLYQRYPGSNEYFFRLVSTFKRTGQEQKILALAQDALKANPLNLTARITLGEYYYNRNQLDKALVELEKTEKITAQYQQKTVGQKGFYLQAVIYGKLGQVDKEKAYLTKTAEIDDKTSYGLKARQLLSERSGAPNPSGEE